MDSTSTASASTQDAPYIVPNTCYTPGGLAGIIIIVLVLVALSISNISLHVKVRRNSKAQQAQLEVLIKQMADDHYYGRKTSASGGKGGGAGGFQLPPSRPRRLTGMSARPVELEDAEMG